MEPCNHECHSKLNLELVFLVTPLNIIQRIIFFSFQDVDCACDDSSVHCKCTQSCSCQTTGCCGGVTSSKEKRNCRCCSKSLNGLKAISLAKSINIFRWLVYLSSSSRFALGDECACKSLVNECACVDQCPCKTRLCSKVKNL